MNPAIGSLLPPSFPSEMLTTILFILRIIVPFSCIAVAARCFTSMRLGKRRKDPVILLEDTAAHRILPVFYWENSIGRSRSSDIVLHDQTVSRSHAVLMRRESGWFVSDTNSKAGTLVNGRKVKERAPVFPGDVISMGATELTLRRVESPEIDPFRPVYRRAASPFSLMWSVFIIQILLAVQVIFAKGNPDFNAALPLGLLMLTEWILYLYSITIRGQVSFELETLAFLLCGIGITLISGVSVKDAFMQLVAIVLGIVFYRMMIWFLGDMDRVTRWRVKIGVLAILMFAGNLLLARSRNGSKNWISLGPVSIQPSELIKVAFIIVGTSTLDRLQTYKNLTGFIGFSAICMGALFLMKDFGTACIFFMAFIIIAFMRSGSVRTVFLACAVAVFGAFLILKIKPYVAQRFEVWHHVWQHTSDSGYQQVRVLSYSASGGFFGVGAGHGCLKNVFASTSDLAFGMMCEELGIILAITVVVILAFLALYARSEATRSRSTLYSIAACAAGGILIFQACLNVFGSTDILPLTGVTLPFISQGGTSMISVWGLLAFLKSSDERTYAVRRRKN